MDTKEKMIVELLNAVGLGVNAKIANPGWYAMMLNQYTTNHFNFKVEKELYLTDKNNMPTEGFLLSYADIDPHRIHTLRVETNGNRITNLRFN